MPIQNDAAFTQVLEAYEERLDAEAPTTRTLTGAELTARRDEFLLPVGREVAELLRDLALGLGAKTIVELGTSYGYSTLFLADAARRTGGRLYTYDVVESKQAYAREHLAQAGLDGYVEWRCGDAVELLRDQPGPIELVLMDLWKDLYVACLDLVHPSLAPGGVIVADNMLYPESARINAAKYRKAVRAKPDLEAILLPIGQGIDVCARILPDV
jgi:predicted O-methyltransferase YrrM